MLLPLELRDGVGKRRERLRSLARGRLEGDGALVRTELGRTIPDEYSGGVARLASSCGGCTAAVSASWCSPFRRRGGAASSVRRAADD